MTESTNERPDWGQQVALVTGAAWEAGGIGRTTAHMLTEKGCRVAITDRDPGIQRTAEWLDAESNADLLVHQGDLSDEAVVVDLIAQVMDRWGRLDILVNNAGGGIIQPFLDHDGDSLKETVNRNLWTALWCCHKALPHMVTQGYGRIVNVGADSVRNGLWNHAGYNAAKGGMHGLTTGLAREFAEHDITINTVAPCVVNTARYRKTVADGSPLAEQFRGVIPKGRPAELDEVAAMIVFLASPESAFTTGQVISVNGGSTML